MNRRITHILLIFSCSLLGCTKYHTEPYYPKSFPIQSNTIEDDLIKAAREGNLQKVKECTEQGASINVEDQGGRTPLHIASAKGHLHVVQYLVEEQNDNIKKRTKDGWAPLHMAAAGGHIAIAQYYVAHGVDINTRTQAGRNPLYLAALYNHPELVKELLNLGADGANALMVAAAAKQWALVDQLLGKGVSLEEKDEKGRSFGERAVEEATATGKLEAIDLALSKEEGSDGYFCDCDGITLVAAAHTGRLEKLVKHLNLNLARVEQIIPIAAQYESVEAIALLIKEGHPEAWQLLAEHGYIAIVEKLLSSRVEMSSFPLMNLLEWATAHEKERIIEILAPRLEDAHDNPGLSDLSRPRSDFSLELSEILSIPSYSVSSGIAISYPRASFSSAFLETPSEAVFPPSTAWCKRCSLGD